MGSNDNDILPIRQQSIILNGSDDDILFIRRQNITAKSQI